MTSAASASPSPALPAAGGPFSPRAIAGLAQWARLGILSACLLGVALLQDGASADALAPKSLWYAVALGLLPGLTAMRLWWGAPLRFPPRSLALALLAWCAAVTLAYLASPLRPPAQAAWQQWMLSALLFCAAVDLLGQPQGRLWLLRSLSVSAGLAGLVSLGQRLGLDLCGGAALRAAFNGRIAGSLGNPNFAGGYFAVALPVLAHQAFAARGRLWLLLARVAAPLACLGLLLGAGKASLLGLGAAAATAGHLCFWSGAAPAARRRALLLVLGGLALAVALAGIFLPMDSLRRVAGGPSAWAESVRFRQVTWAGTLDLAGARPLQGWGPGTFGAAYPSYRRPEAMADQQQHAYEVTSPECWPLQLLAETGALGLLAALALLAVLLAPLRRAARAWDADPDGAGLCLAVLCSAAACLACNLASLDLFLPSTALPLLLLLAMGTGLAAGEGRAVTLNPEPYARLLVTGSLLFMASVPVVGGQLHAEAARLLAQGRALSRAGRFADAVPVYGLAVQFDPALLEARYFMGASLVDAGGDSNLARAADAFASLRAWAPDYVQVHAQLGRLCALQGRVPEAAQEYEYQLKLDPWDLGTVEALATLYAGNRRLAEAEDLLADAARRWPENGDIARNLLAVQKARMGLGRRK